MLHLFRCFLFCCLLRDSFCTFPHVSPNDQLLPDVPTAGSHIPLKSLFLFRPYFTCSEKQFQTCRFSSLEPLNTRFTGKVPVVSEEHAEWNIISAKLFWIIQLETVYTHMRMNMRSFLVRGKNTLGRLGYLLFSIISPSSDLYALHFRWLV